MAEPEPDRPHPEPGLVSEALVTEAVSLARRAGELTLGWFRRSNLDVEAKSDGTPVTAADRAAERFLRDELAARHPEDGILGEEEPERDGTSGRRWIIDPIDGTKAFTRGVPLYTNLVAIEDATGIVAGVINVPALGETVWAGRGLGAWCNDRPARVSASPTLEGAWCTTSSFAPWAPAAFAAARDSGLNLRTWGDGYGYALAATGRVDAMVDPRAELYDLAPMPVIMAEAGGRFTSLEGSPGAADGSGVATNGAIHGDLLALLGGDAARVDTVLG